MHTAGTKKQDPGGAQPTSQWVAMRLWQHKHGRRSPSTSLVPPARLAWTSLWMGAWGTWKGSLRTRSTALTSSLCAIMTRLARLAFERARLPRTQHGFSEPSFLPTPPSSTIILIGHHFARSYCVSRVCNPGRQAQQRNLRWQLHGLLPLCWYARRDT
jgi:hypothetical protein